MCDKSVADYVAALKFALNWFVANKMIKGLVNTFTQMKIYSILIKILVMSNFLVMKWVLYRS